MAKVHESAVGMWIWFTWSIVWPNSAASEDDLSDESDLHSDVGNELIIKLHCEDKSEIWFDLSVLQIDSSGSGYMFGNFDEYIMYFGCNSSVCNDRLCLEYYCDYPGRFDAGIYGRAVLEDDTMYGYYSLEQIEYKFHFSQCV